MTRIFKVRYLHHGSTYLPFLLSLALVGLVQATTADPNPSSSLTTHCRILAAVNVTLPQGGSGTVRFSCGINPAFTVSRAGKSTPTFKLPTGYTALTIVPHAIGKMVCQPGVRLTSGVSIAFSEAGAFDYCTAYSSTPGSILASFVLKWSPSEFED